MNDLPTPHDPQEKKTKKKEKKDRKSKKKTQDNDEAEEKESPKKEKKEKRTEKDKEKEKLQYEKLKASDYNPYSIVDFMKPHGKIQIGDEDNFKKYQYYLIPLNEESNYYEPFDWKEKGVVRKRFEQVKRTKLIKHQSDLAKIKEKVEEVKDAVKGLEKLTGPLDDIRKSIMEQYRKTKYMQDPQQYYKELFQLLNPPSRHKEQIDVRMMPPYYAHRKIKIALSSVNHYMKKEKERKFKTTLSDHILFTIICDSKKIEEEPATGDQQQNLGVVIQSTETGEIVNKEAIPQMNSICLLIHRILKDHFEYVFLTDENAKAEIGCFIVYVSGLRERE